jgi:23S rRNA pseudouridine1911/1915/1917 synthase
MPAIRIVHADDDLLVVDKPAGVLVVPAPGRGGQTVVDRVSTQEGVRAVAVHRLDEDTTGALVLALTDAGRTGMERLFREHAVTRDYLALTSGTPSPPAGRIASRLQEDAAGIVRVVAGGGVEAITHYETVGRRDRCALVQCRLETGRRNQIRAHFAALGCPLAGDRKYGFRARPGEHFSRVMLHSWRIEFLHPVSGARVRLEIPPAEAILHA